MTRERDKEGTRGQGREGRRGNKVTRERGKMREQGDKGEGRGLLYMTIKYF